MKLPTFTECLLGILVALSTLMSTNVTAEENAKPNILLVTVEDMNCDSVGSFGCKLEATTPHIDALAAQDLRYNYAHVQVGNCVPSRNVMFSGLYPHATTL